MSTEPVTYDLVDGVATICLANPDRRNVLDQQVLQLLGQYAARAGSDDSVRVIVLTSSGTAFCAGADLMTAASGDAGSFAADAAGHLADVLGTWLDVDKPIVARVQGPVAGGGNGLLAVCDVVVASAAASFAFREVRVGVAPAVIAVPLLSRLAPGVVRDLMLTGRTFDANEALSTGLVHRVVLAEELDAAVAAVIADLLAGGPQAQSATKQLLRQLPGKSRDEAFDVAARLSAARFASQEAQEGISAFKQKRRPNW